MPKNSAGSASTGSFTPKKNEYREEKHYDDKISSTSKTFQPTATEYSNIQRKSKGSLVVDYDATKANDRAIREQIRKITED